MLLNKLDKNETGVEKGEGRVVVACRERGTAFASQVSSRGKILASIPNDFKRLSKKLIEVTNVQSLSSVAPSLPVVIPQTLPMPSITAEPESPRAENEPDFEFLGSTHNFFDILPGRPLIEYVLTKARMVLRRPMVWLDALPFFMNIVVVQVGRFEYLLIRNEATKTKKTAP